MERFSLLLVRAFRQTKLLAKRKACAPILQNWCAPDKPAITTQSIAPEIYPQAKALYARLELANSELYQTIRREIQRSAGPYGLLQRLANQSSQSENTTSPTVGEGYDYLDELVSGVLQFEEPATSIVQLPAEMVF